MQISSGGRSVSRGYGEAMSSAASMVDWDLAGRTARRLAGAGPSTTREEAAAVVRELHEAAATAVADPQAPTTQPTDTAPTHRPHEQKGDAR